MENKEDPAFVEKAPNVSNQPEEILEILLNLTSINSTDNIVLIQSKNVKDHKY